MCNTTGHDDSIHLTLQGYIAGTYLTSNGVEHGIHHTLERLFTGFGLGRNGNHIVHAEMSREATTTIEHLLDLKFAVLTTEAKVHQLTGRDGSGTFGTERTVAIEGIVHINHLALAMGTYRDTTTQVHHNDVQIFIFLTDRSGILAGYRLTVQGMEDRFAFDVRNTGITGFGHEFIRHFRVGNESRTMTFFGQLHGNQRAEVTSMFHFGMNQVMLHLLIDGIDTTRSRFQQTSTGDDRIELDRNTCLCQHVAHKLLAVRQLFDDMGVWRQVFQRMVSTPYPYRFIVFIQSQLGRS